MTTQTNGYWEAHWSGSYPNLCHGSWELLHDGHPIDTQIPFQNSYAGTLGNYGSWFFGGDSGWKEEWEFHDEGADCKEWCERYQEWLSSIAPEGEWQEIFEAFQAEDWRHNSCGGCI